VCNQWSLPDAEAGEDGINQIGRIRLANDLAYRLRSRPERVGGKKHFFIFIDSLSFFDLFDRVLYRN
jgi:hypothetical protein